MKAKQLWSMEEGECRSAYREEACRESGSSGQVTQEKDQQAEGDRVGNGSYSMWGSCEYHVGLGFRKSGRFYCVPAYQAPPYLLSSWNLNFVQPAVIPVSDGQRALEMKSLGSHFVLLPSWSNLFSLFETIQKETNLSLLLCLVCLLGALTSSQREAVEADALSHFSCLSSAELRHIQSQAKKEKKILFKLDTVRQ